MQVIPQEIIVQDIYGQEIIIYGQELQAKKVVIPQIGEYFSMGRIEGIVIGYDDEVNQSLANSLEVKPITISQYAVGSNSLISSSIRSLFHL